MPLIETITANVTGIPSIDPLLVPIRGFFKVTSALIGGLFGLYFIFFFIRLFYWRKIMKEVKLLRRDVQKLHSRMDDLQKNNVRKGRRK